MSTSSDKAAPVKRFFRSPLFLAIAFPLAVLLVVAYVRSYVSSYYIQQEIQDLEAQIQDLETKKLESIELLEYVLSDDFVEEKARTELNLRKPGENVIIVSESVPSDVDASIPEQGTRQYTPNPIKWWYYFTKPNQT